MASRLISHLHPLLIPLCNQFLKKCKTSGLDVFLSCTYRDIEEQLSIWKSGRALKNGLWVIVDKNKVKTKKMPGKSAHNVKVNGKPAAMAFDFFLVIDGKANWDEEHPQWKLAVQHGIDCGLKSLKPFEFAHFEIPNWEKIISEKTK